MVRLNQDGIPVPVLLADFKNLPVIPHTGTRTAKNETALENEDEWQQVTTASLDRLKGKKNRKSSSKGGKPQFRRRNQGAHDRSQSNLYPENQSERPALEDESITVFDIVHRGRQKDQELKNKARLRHAQGALSPRIISPAAERLRSLEHPQSSGIQSKARLLRCRSGTSGASSAYLRSNRPLSLNHKHGMTKQEKKQAIKQLHQDVQSATLPQIKGATRLKSGGARKTSAAMPTEKEHKASTTGTIEYLHEVQYDAETRSQWTFFNKHAILRVDEEAPETPYEEVIADEMDIGGTTQNDNACDIPKSTWVALYQAKCMDLGIPCKPDKHQERFVTQMMLQ